MNVPLSYSHSDHGAAGIQLEVMPAGAGSGSHAGGRPQVHHSQAPGPGQPVPGRPHCPPTHPHCRLLWVSLPCPGRCSLCRLRSTASGASTFALVRQINTVVLFGRSAMMSLHSPATCIGRTQTQKMPPAWLRLIVPYTAVRLWPPAPCPLHPPQLTAAEQATHHLTGTWKLLYCDLSLQSLIMQAR